MISYVPYRFLKWENIDIFVYFGHKMLTIPPPAYIDIAHTNGVKILATLIFEWDRGNQELIAILSSDGAGIKEYLNSTPSI